MLDKAVLQIAVASVEPLAVLVGASDLAGQHDPAAPLAIGVVAHTALRSSRTSPSRIWSAAYRLAAATWCGASGCTALVATSRVPWSAVCRYSITRSAISEQSMAD